MKKPDQSNGQSKSPGISRYPQSPTGSVRRTLYISLLAFVNAIIVGFIAKGLILLIGFFTNLFFYGRHEFEEASPAGHQLGYWVIAVPVLGGLIVGIMARFGSRAIRGHGIPEAMEKIAKEQSKIPPLITFLKPLSAAISIGSGGPFGAEGPIISTGGALGSFCGQTLRITSNERKVLLAAGATAGMTAIFGTPFAAILLAIELLLFEFSARSFIPVTIACVTGACMHFILFGLEPTFPMPNVPIASTQAVIAYAVIGLLTGMGAVIATKILYVIEDGFEKLPIHWMWWPAIGGVVVGVIGMFAPATLGVGYDNITNALTGELPATMLISLCLWKFVSWAFALGSGTSGGTLAPLLTIGSSLGCLLGIAGQQAFPDVGITLPMAALVGMAAMFAGSSRALLTSIVFALETTMQESTLLPLIAGCVASYMVSFILMRNTIMTEKIKRRGITLPDSYHPDVLAITTVEEILEPLERKRFIIIKESESVNTLRQLLADGYDKNTIVVVKDDGITLSGIVKTSNVPANGQSDHHPITTLMARRVYTVDKEHSLEAAVEVMLAASQSILPVIESPSHQLLGIVTERDILEAFEQRVQEERHIHRHISMRRETLNVLKKSRAIFRNSTK